MKKPIFLTLALFQLLVTSFLRASPVDALSCAPTFHKIGVVSGKTIDEETVTLDRIYAYGLDQDQGNPFSSTLYGSPAVFRIDVYEKIVNAYLNLQLQSSKPILVPSEYIIEEGTIAFTPIEDTEDWSKEKVYIHQTRDREVSWGAGDILVVGGTMCTCGYSLKGVFTPQGEAKTILLDTSLTTYSYRGTSITPTAVNYDLNNAKFRVGDEEFSLEAGESFSSKSKYVESITLSSTQGGCWGEESVSFDLVLRAGESEMPNPSPSPKPPPPLPPQPNSVLIPVFMLLIGVAATGIFFISFRKGRGTNFPKDFRTEIKIALIGIGILIFAGVGLLIILSYSTQKVSYPIEKNPPEVGVSEGVPTTYVDCMRTDSRYNFQQRNRSQLSCSYTVGGEHSAAINPSLAIDAQKFEQCVELGGYSLTFAGDCTLLLHNPSYEFPATYEECVRENKGEFSDSPKNRCMINIDPSYAYNKSVATKLVNECIALGGDRIEQWERSPRCYMEFEEGESITKPQTIQKPQITSEKLLGSGECKELVPNHNKIAENRIDLVFIGFGYDLIGKFKSFAEQAVSGSYSEEPGLLEVEPFRSNKETFNFWFVDKMGKSESQDLWKLSPICRKKLGINDHKFSRETPLFSDRMFTFIFINKAGFSSGSYDHSDTHQFYAHDDTNCTAQKEQGRCGLKGLTMRVSEEQAMMPASYIQDFVHVFAHAFTFYNINIEYRPNIYYEVLDEYVRFDIPYSLERDWKYIVRDHSNCFVGTSEQCVSKRNTLFGDMIGDGCGKDGVIDCCTNNSVAIEKGALSCEACPDCKEDSRYDIEVACYEGCWFNQGNYRSTFDSIMRGRSDTQEFGRLNEKILCHQIKLLTGEAGGICNELLK